MIAAAFLRAVGQLFDRRFLGVLLKGVALSVLLLAAVCAGLVTVLDRVVPATLTLPRIGQIGHLHGLVGIGSLLVMIGLSVFLMVPVAALFTGFFLDTVADAVEDRHFPALPPVPRQGWGEAILGAVSFFGVLIAVNLVALLLYGLVGPLAPVMFWAVNGWLIGREYFELAAARRIGRAAARDLRRANAGRVWLAGALMAAPLSVPFVNLFIPVVGAATFTHLFHAMADRRSR